MGVNYSLDDVPGWDYTVNGGMRDIFGDGERFPVHDKPNTERTPWEIGEALQRPADFELWRKNLAILFDDAEGNLEMWLMGLEALEADPNLWFEISY